MAVMWQSTWASSVVTRPLNMYQATASAMRTTSKAPFTMGCRFCSQWRKEKDCCGVCDAAAGAAAAGCGVGGRGGVGVELMIRFTFHFVYMASISPGERAGGRRDKLN